MTLGPIPKKKTADSDLQSKRGGYSLIQMLIVMSILGTVSVIAIRLMSTLLRVERQGIAHVTQLSSLSRLSRQFRADAHVARECKLLQPPETGVVRLTIDKDHSIVYDKHERGISRVEQKAGQVLRRDQFRLSGVALACEVPTDPEKIVTLVVGQSLPDQSSQSTPSKNFRIDARLGRDVVEP